MTRVANHGSAICPVCIKDSGITPSLDRVGETLSCISCQHPLMLECEEDGEGSPMFWLETWTDEDERNRPHPDDGYLDYLPSSGSPIVWGKK